MGFDGHEDRGKKQLVHIARGEGVVRVELPQPVEQDEGQDVTTGGAVHEVGDSWVRKGLLARYVWREMPTPEELKGVLTSWAGDSSSM